MNKVILMGRPTRDPEVRYSQTQSGEQMAIARYTLAVNRRFKRDGEQEADFISCVAFGKNANKDGNKVYTTDVVVEEQEFAESKNASGGSQPQGAPNPANAAGPASPNGFMNIPDGIEDDLPFK